MDFKILDSQLREFLETEANPWEIARLLSLTSVSIEKVETYKKDYLYTIEVTTNRVDLASVVGLAREAAAALVSQGIPAKFIPAKIETVPVSKSNKLLEVKNDLNLVPRLCLAIMDVQIKDSPLYLKERLEAAGIRSLNNLIDITNYVMLTIGHPTHVFDYDRLLDHQINIREAKKGEKLTTLDHKTYILEGGEIIATDGEGKIIDLIGVMGLENSVVTSETKRIVFFINNNNTHKIRTTSMNLGIRTEAAIRNEKELAPELALEALFYGIKLYKDLAKAKLHAPAVDLHTKEALPKAIILTLSQIQEIIGVEIKPQEIKSILVNLDFKVEVEREIFKVTPTTLRSKDIKIAEDVIEEIARIYGYHRIPNKLPLFNTQDLFQRDDFVLESQLKHTLKNWGFTEVYTYSMVGEDLLEGSLERAVKLKNPLNKDMAYLRTTLIPSLMQVVLANKTENSLCIFEIANTYQKQENSLPNEVMTLAILLKENGTSFFYIKGIIEELALQIGIDSLQFAQDKNSTDVFVFVQKILLGRVKIIDEITVAAEIELNKLLPFASKHKTYTPLSKYPAIFEDITLITPPEVLAEQIVELIKKQSLLIKDVYLIDKYKDAKTYRIVYRSQSKNLTNEDVKPIREQINKKLITTLKATIK